MSRTSGRSLAAVLVVLTALAAVGAGGVAATERPGERAAATSANATQGDVLTVQKGNAQAYNTIGAAVDAADEGDTVLVRPLDPTGDSVLYRASVRVEKNITITTPQFSRARVAPDDGFGDDSVFEITGNAAPTIESFVFEPDPGQRARAIVAVSAPRTSGDWVLRNSEVEGYAAVNAERSSGDWRVEDVAVDGDGVMARVIDAQSSSGNWSVVGSEVTDTEESVVDADDTDGDWSVESTTFRNVSSAITAERSTGDWAVTGGRIDGTALASIQAQSASGNWTVRDTVIANASGHVVGAERTTGAWTIGDTLIRDSQYGIYAYGSTGGWTVANTTIRNVSSVAVQAARTDGGWVFRDNRVVNASGVVTASESTGAWRLADTTVSGTRPLATASGTGWTIENTVVRRIPSGFGETIHASGSGFTIRNTVIEAGRVDEGGIWVNGTGSIRNVRVSGAEAEIAWVGGRGTIVNAVVRGGLELRDSSGVLRRVRVLNSIGSGVLMTGQGGGHWRFDDVTIRGAEERGIWGRYASQDVTMTDTRIVGSGRSGIFASNPSAGNWTIRDSVIRDNGYRGIEARFVASDWRITGSTITGNDAAGINAEFADRRVDATGNWWGDSGGPDPGQCVGNVTCAAPLSIPSTQAATVTGTVTDGNGTPVAGATVYLFGTNTLHQRPRPTLGQRLLGQERLTGTEPTLLLASLYAAETDGNGEYTISGVNPADPSSLTAVVVPPAASPLNVGASGPFRVRSDGTAAVDVRLTSRTYLDDLDDEFAAVQNATRAAINRTQLAAARTYVDGGKFILSKRKLSAKPGPLTIVGAIGDVVSGPDAEDIAERGFRRAVSEQALLNAAKSIGTSKGISASESTLFAIYADRWNRFVEVGVDEEMARYHNQVARIGWLRAFEAGSGGPRLDRLGTGAAVERSHRRGYDRLPAENTAQDVINDSRDAYERLSKRAPAPGFSSAYAASVLRNQRDAFRGDQFIEGVVVSPQGRVYATATAETYREDYLAAKAQYKQYKAQQRVFQVAGVVGSFVEAAGYALAPETGGTSAALGEAVAAVATYGEFVARSNKILAVGKLYDRFGQTQVYHLRDLDSIAAANAAVVDWLANETRNPTFGEGAITRVDVNADTVVRDDGRAIRYVAAEQPENCVRTGCRYADKNATVTVRNTGDTASEARIITATYPVGAGEPSPPVPGDVVSVVPDKRGEPMTLAPGETRTVNVSYTAVTDQTTVDRSLVVTALWVDDRIVDTDVKRVHPLAPTFIEQRTGGATGASRRVAYATAAGASVPRTLSARSDLAARTESLATATLSPSNASFARRVTVPANASATAFRLVAPPTADVTLAVVDRSGRRVGYDPASDRGVVERPEAGYSGAAATVESVSLGDAAGETLTVLVNGTFRTAGTAEVDLTMTTTPDRPPILAVSPPSLSGTISPGDALTEGIRISEAAGQDPLRGGSVSVSPLTNTAGTALSATGAGVSLTTASFAVGPANRTTTGLSVTVPEGATVPDGEPTRFTGRTVVGTSNAGRVTLNTSVLVLDTNVTNATLQRAGENVTGLHLDRTAPASVPTADASGTPTVHAAYDLATNGTGTATLTLDNPAPDRNVTAFRVANGTWTPVGTVTATGTVTVTVAARDGLLVLVDPSAPTVPGGVGPATNLDADGAFEDVDGDGRGTAADALLYFDKRDTDAIRSNPSLFDFDGDGVAGAVGDALALAEELD